MVIAHMSQSMSETTWDQTSCNAKKLPCKWHRLFLSGLTLFNLKALSSMQSAQKERKMVKSLPCYLEFYLLKPLLEHFFPNKRVSIAIKPISASLEEMVTWNMFIY